MWWEIRKRKPYHPKDEAGNRRTVAIEAKALPGRNRKWNHERTREKMREILRVQRKGSALRRTREE